MSLLRKVIVVWFDEKCNRYYYKISSQTYKRYQIGVMNQYGHRVVLIIPLFDIKKYLKGRMISWKGVQMLWKH